MHVKKIKKLLSGEQLGTPEVLDAEAEALRCPALVELVCEALRSSGGEHGAVKACCIAHCCGALRSSVCGRLFRAPGPTAQRMCSTSRLGSGLGLQRMAMLH